RKDRFLKLRTATATIGIKGSLGEGVTGPDFTSLANLGGEIDLDDTQIPLGEIAFKVDNIHFQIQIFKNPNYAPDVPEDEQETSKPDSLDTTDPKLSEPDPAVKKAVSKYVVKVTREGDPSGAPWNPMDEYKKDYQNVTNTEKVRVNIEVEP
ncbi:hypothetical protein KKA14_00585, partial [bacterium]|nr:hypothetical protein [bacterium]